MWTRLCDFCSISFLAFRIYSRINRPLTTKKSDQEIALDLYTRWRDCIRKSCSCPSSSTASCSNRLSSCWRRLSVEEYQTGWQFGILLQGSFMEMLRYLLAMYGTPKGKPLQGDSHWAQQGSYTWSGHPQPHAITWNAPSCQNCGCCKRKGSCWPL